MPTRQEIKQAAAAATVADPRWRSHRERDTSRDGEFFIGVTTTGVYCLPSCSGRPNPENVVFHDTVDQARQAGLRPCKRCKPDDFTQKSARAYTTMPSPVGELTLVANDDALVAVLWENDDPKRVRIGLTAEDRSHPVLVDALRQLQAYFAGTLESFSLPLEFVGTDFQKRVWSALLAIPFGEKRTYAQIAKQIGKSDAVRAVGAAIGRNPISIVTPCHRVVGSDGRLTGFAGGLPAKALLLSNEARPRSAVA